MSFQLHDAHARRSDPASSDRTVRSIAKDGSLRAEVWAAARSFFGARFTDTELRDRLESRTARRWERNVVARTRGLLELDGKIDRDPYSIGLLRFFVPSQQDQGELF